MAGRTAYEAVANYVSPRQQAVSCVTQSILRTPGGFRPPDGPVDLVLGSGEPVRLRGPERIHLRVRFRLRVTQANPPRGLWDAMTAAYEYRRSDQDDREIVAYHWHPEGQSHVQTPHLHLGSGAEIGRATLLTAHLPTGPVYLADVLRLAIESFTAEPARRDWDRVLDAASHAG